MKILCISDIHGDAQALGRILDREKTADLVVLAGDLTDRGTVAKAEEIIARALAFSAHVVAVAGNCDSPLIDQMLTERGVGLHGHKRVFHHHPILGLSGVSSRRIGQYAFKESDFARFLEEAASDVTDHAETILVAHTPPRGIVDRTHFGFKAGSHAIRSWVESHAPRIVVCGHIHEAHGAGYLGSTLVVNCGPAYKHRYAVIQTDGRDSHPEIHRFKPQGSA